MTHYDVKRLALVLAKQAEIEGMKASNDHCKAIGREPNYNQIAFEQMANQLLDIANMHDEQL